MSSGEEIKIDHVEDIKVQESGFGANAVTARYHHVKSARETYLDNLPPARRKLGKAIEHQYYDQLLAVIICGNLICVVIETDKVAADEPVPMWVHLYNWLSLCYYCLELGVRFFVFQKDFFKTGAHIADFVIVVMDLVFAVLDMVLDMPKMSILRVFRLSRLARAVHILQAFPELGLLVNGLAGAVRACAWGASLLLIILVIFSIFSVQLVNPTVKELMEEEGYPYEDGFSSTWRALLTSFQIAVVGDSWGSHVNPLVSRNPALFFYFLILFMTVSVTLLNVILGVVVQDTEATKNKNLEALAHVKEGGMKEARQQAYSLLEAMDADGSGTLSFDELMTAFETNPDFQDLMRTMECRKEDMDMVWGVLDSDGSGDVTYAEFIEALYKLKQAMYKSDHVMICFISHHISELRRQLAVQERQALDKAKPPKGPKQYIGAVPMAANGGDQSIAADKSHTNGVCHVPHQISLGDQLAIVIARLGELGSQVADCTAKLEDNSKQISHLQDAVFASGGPCVTDRRLPLGLPRLRQRSADQASDESSFQL